MPIGESGIFYPAGCFHEDVLNEKFFNTLCPNADNFWFYWMARLMDCHYSCVPSIWCRVNWPRSQGVALFRDKDLYYKHDKKYMLWYENMDGGLIMQNDITVIVAAWNAEATIERCVNSVFKSQDVGLKVIVIDDCSTDGTAEKLNALKENYPSLIYMKTKENSGPSCARNLGLTLAQGKWIAIVDADDTIEPNRLHDMVQYAVNTKSDICFDNMRLYLSDKKRGVNRPLVNATIANELSNLWSLETYLSFNLPYKSEVLLGFLKPLFRRSFLNENCLSYREDLRNSEDFILIVECLLHDARITYLDKTLYNYYIYNNSLTGTFNIEAHLLLIETERNIKKKYFSRLMKKDLTALASHINALESAGVSNMLFSALRQRDLLSFLKYLYDDKRRLHIHLYRIYYAVIRKIFHISNRGA